MYVECSICSFVFDIAYDCSILEAKDHHLRSGFPYDP
jgi:hypothetical protein